MGWSAAGSVAGGSAAGFRGAGAGFAFGKETGGVFALLAGIAGGGATSSGGGNAVVSGAMFIGRSISAAMG